MKVRLIIASAITALAFPAIALAGHPKTGPITDYSFTCKGPSFTYNNLPDGTRIWLRYTLGHQPFVLTLEQLVILSGSGTFTEPVPAAVEQPTTVLDALVRVPSQGVQLDRSVTGGCAPAPPLPPPVVVTPVPPPVVPTVAPPPTPHHPMCHHKHHKRHHHRRKHHKRRHHKLKVCKLPGGSGHICGTPVRKSGNG